MTLRKVENSLFRDSKQLSVKQRDDCYTQLHIYAQEKSIVAAVGMSSADYIDTHGIIKALHHASLQAIRQVLKQHFFSVRHKALLASRHGEDVIAALELEKLFTLPCTAKHLTQVLTTKQSVLRIV